MKLTLNGETIEYTGEATLAALVCERGADPKQVATMLNDEVVTRTVRADTPLKTGDRVEMLSFAGGG
jgi:sulfur carrier protein